MHELGSIVKLKSETKDGTWTMEIMVTRFTARGNEVEFFGVIKKQKIKKKQAAFTDPMTMASLTKGNK